jgi:nitrite reductase/ring-hydroxylating ferredoxin subunit/uncharacterized membrane protein
MKKRISDLIAHQDWLNPVEEGLQKAVQKTYGSMGQRGHRIEDALHGTWLGQPLHVALTDIPIGAWTAAMIFDVVDVVTGRDEFGAAADAAIGIGLVGAAGSAITGLTDWQAVDPPARRVGVVHALLNVTGVALFSSALLQRNRSRGARRLLAALGWTASLMAAHLGGDLVYEHKIGVDHSRGEALPDDFVAIMADSDLPEGQPRRVEHNGAAILLVRRVNRIFAINETCSHLGGPLSEGKLEGNTIECPWHGSIFSLEDGSVLNGPSVHPEPCLDTRVRNGQIEVRKRRWDEMPGAAQKVPSGPVDMRRTGTGH